MARATSKRRTRPAPKPKIGADEFLAVARRFGFSAAAMKRIAGAVSDDDLPAGGASLCRWYCTTPELIAGTRLEQVARDLFATKYVLPVSSGTGALHAAFVAAGVGPGAEVICPALGFIATAGAVAMAGGVPVFSDVDESLHLNPARIEAAITPRTVAVAPTHHWGAQADMAAICRIARKHKLKVVEDCAQSPGGKYKGRYLGTLGDLGCFSISAYKITGAGEGGLVLAKTRRLYERACQLAEFGGLWRPDRFAAPRYDGELFVGTNYRMSELEAAIDVVQLRKLNATVNRFRAARKRVVRRLKTFAQITPQTINDPDGQVGYMLRFFPETASLGVKLAAALTAAGVPARCRGAGHRPDWHLCAYMFPVQPVADRYRDCPVARDLYAREVSVHIDSAWTAAQCREVADTINRVLAEHCDPDNNAAGWA